jgi:hypothetical protein
MGLEEDPMGTKKSLVGKNLKSNHDHLALWIN